MGTRYRILFRGKIHEGYDAALVRKLAAFRLNASPTQIERLFAGKKVMIKGDLPSEEVANLYVDELAKLGMIAWAEPERAKPQASSPKAPEAARPELMEASAAFNPSSTYLTHPISTHQSSAELQDNNPDTVQDIFDPQKTTLNIALAEQILRESSPLPAPMPVERPVPPVSAPVLATPARAELPSVPSAVAPAPFHAEVVAKPAIVVNTTTENVYCPHCGVEISELFDARGQHMPPSLHVFPSEPPPNTPPASSKTKGSLQTVWRRLFARVKGNATLH